MLQHISRRKIVHNRSAKLLGELLLLVLVGSCLLAMSNAEASDGDNVLNQIYGFRTLKFDVAESAPKFVFDEAPLIEEGDFKGFPDYGNAFITQGFIYPYGTLDGGSGDAPGTGVNPDGSPEFPDLVIGEWTCRGYFIGNGAQTASGPWVITTQHYDFYDQPGFDPAVNQQSGKTNLVTDGYELADIGVVGERPVTGGTGRFKRARGEAKQTLLGFNATEGVVLRFRIRVR